MVEAVTADSIMTFLSQPGFMAANEHIQSRAVQLEGFPLPPPKLFLRQLVHKGAFVHSTLCRHDCSPPHLENVTVVTCVECVFVSHFIGGKIGIATFFHIKLCILEASSHRTYTPTLSPGLGTVGFM